MAAVMRVLLDANPLLLCSSFIVIKIQLLVFKVFWFSRFLPLGQFDCSNCRLLVFQFHRCMRLKVLYSVAKPFLGGGFRFFKNMKVFLTDQGICCFFWRRNLKENHHHHLLLLLLLVFFYGSLLQKKKRTIGEEDYSFFYFIYFILKNGH